MGTFDVSGLSRFSNFSGTNLGIMDLSSLNKGSPVLVYMMPSPATIRALKGIQSPEVTELLSRLNDLCKRDITNIVPVNLSRENHQLKMSSSSRQKFQETTSRQNVHEKMEVKVVSEFEDLINKVQGKQKGSEASAKDTKTASPKASTDKVTIVEQSEEEEAQMQKDFKDLVDVIHQVSIGALDKKQEKESSVMPAQSRKEGRQAQPRPQKAEFTPSYRTETAQPKSSGKRTRDAAEDPAIKKRRRSEQLTEDLDEAARIRETAAKKDQQKKEIQQDRSK